MSKDKKNDIPADVLGNQALSRKELPLNKESIELVEEGNSRLDSNDSPYTLFGLLVVGLAFGVFGGWAALAPLNSAAVASGEVVVVANNRVVQHLEGGMVEQIFVKEGELVEKGQPLVSLSPVQLDAEMASVNSRLNELIGKEARLKSERAESKKITYPAGFLEKALEEPHVEEIITSQNELHRARMSALLGEINIYNKRKNGLKEQVVGLTSLVDSLQDRIDSTKSEIEDWEALYKEQYADKVRLQEMQRSLSALLGDLNSKQSEISRLNLQVLEVESQISQIKKQFVESVVAELRQAQAEKAELAAKITALTDKRSRLLISAPVSGTINGFEVYTIKQVIPSGQTLMEIVPNTREYAVTAKVALTDIDKVYRGLIADIRFSAFNTQTTHVIEGEVTRVSADKFFDDKTGNEYFEARVVMTPNGVKQMEEDGIFLLPGMPADVMIKTGERTFLGYILKPFQDMLAKGFNED